MDPFITDPHTDLGTNIAFCGVNVIFTVLCIYNRCVALHLIANPNSPDLVDDLVEFSKHLFDFQLKGATPVVAPGIWAMVLIVYGIAESVAIALKSRVFAIFFSIIDWITCIILFVIYIYLGGSPLLVSFLLTFILSMIMTGLGLGLSSQ